MHAADTIQIAASDVLAPASLRDPKVREGMSSAAVRLFLKLADHWISVDQRLALLATFPGQRITIGSGAKLAP